MCVLFFICHPYPSDNEVNRYPLKWNTIVQKEIVGILVGGKQWCVNQGERFRKEDSDIYQLGI